MSDLGNHLEAVVRKVKGDPNPHHSTKEDLRFGTNGSLSVKIAGDDAGVWYDHEKEIGGGTLDFLRVEKNLTNGEAFDYMRGIGLDVGQPPALASGKWTFVEDYRYPDANNVVRYRIRKWLKPDGGKSFSQERADGKGGWIKGKGAMDGVELVPYRLPELLAAIADGKTILIPEGEKDVNNLYKFDFASTCNPGGAGKWPAGFSEHFQGADVVILADNDKAGRDHADLVASNLKHVARRVRILDMPSGTPEKGDISWHIEQGANVDRINEMLIHARDVSAPKPTAAAVKADFQDDDGPFVVTESGVFFRYSKDGEDMLDKISSRLDVVAVTHDESGNGWGRVMRFPDLAGRMHEWAMPMSLAAGDGSEIRAELLDQGLRIEPFKHAGQRIIQYITSSAPTDTWLSVTRPGWHGDYYIMPGETFGNGKQRAVLQRERSFKHNFREQGTLVEWQENIARLCVGNAYLAFGVSSAFAAPLLNLTQEQGGGFHFRGGSSCGKSTTLEVAGSVMGGGGQNGYLTSWRATDNGLEGVGESHCDALLCIDEIGQADPRTLGQTAYMLANGQGKIRASKTGSARAPAEWRLLFLSNGEESLASRMNEAGSKTHAGMEVRLADIPVCGKWGVIDELHEFAESRDLVNHLKKAARRFYGSPIREYLRRLVMLDRNAVAKEVTACQIEFQRKYVPHGSGEQVERVAKRFALAAAGGELATDMGITGWEAGEAMKAAAGCFKAWLGARGTIGNTEDASAVDQVRTFLEVHGASRFSFMDEDDNGVEDHRVINRAGYKRRAKDGRTEYLLFRNVFRNEVCKGFDFQNVETLLIKRGFLAVDSSGKHQITAKRSAGYRDEAGNLVTDKSGQPRTVDRFYCVLPAIFTES